MAGPADEESDVPSSFEEYRILAPLGQGGMGKVYLAHDTLLDRPVAIKLIASSTPDPATRERFFVEARAIARLSHPNVVAIYRVGEVRRRPFLVSEFVRGRSLDKLAKPIPWQQALKLGIGLCRGLATAHRRGVLHRDIKPGNAMLAEDGEVKLLDFGLAKLLDTTPPLAGLTTADTPAAPEGAGGVSASPAAAAPHAVTDALAATRDSLPAGAAAPSTAAPADALAATCDSLPRRSVVPAPRPPALPAAPAAASPPPIDTPRATSGGSLRWIDTRSLTQDGQLVGTPLYMAPESWRGEPATRRTDVYALGVLLYELCAGHPPYQGDSLRDLARFTQEVDARPLATLATAIHPGLAALIDRCLARDPAHRPDSGDALLASLERIAQSSRAEHSPAGSLPPGNPYRGLATFDAEHRALFFGRAVEIHAVLGRLRAEPFVLVAGDSGVGKSSLCRAGVLPLVQEGALSPGERQRQVLTLVPGRQPLLALSSALAPHLTQDEAAVDALLRTDPRRAAHALRSRPPEAGRLLLFLDQLEELLTLADPTEAALCAEALAALCLHGGGLRLLCTARSDYLARLMTLPGLGDEIQNALYLLRPLSASGLREAIVGPAAATGCTFESEALIDELAGATASTSGGLPLLQFALAELWEARDHERGVIPAAALSAIGGVSGALARHADGVLAALLPAQREAARRLLVRLITPEGTRARRSEGELLSLAHGASGAANLQAALQALLRGRLLLARVDEGDGVDASVDEHAARGGTSYEIAHEALISGWEALRRMLMSSEAGRITQQRLERAAAEWHRLGRSAEALWSETQQSEARAAGLDAEALTPMEVEFLRASERALRVRRWQRRGALAAAPLCLALAYGGVTLYDHRALTRAVDTRLREARAFYSQALGRAAQEDALRQRAFAAFDRESRSGSAVVDQDSDASAEPIWSSALTLAPAVDADLARAAQLLEDALLLDSHHRAARQFMGEVLYQQSLRAERDHRQGQRDDLRRRLSNYDEGGRLRQALSAPAHLTLTTEPSGALVEIQRMRWEGCPGEASDRAGGCGSGARTFAALLPRPGGPALRTPLTELSLPPGSYLLMLRRPESAQPLRYPLLLGRGERSRLSLALPARVPAGYVYVPPGRFLYGVVGDEELRKTVLTAQPQHPVTLEGYLISRTEVTFGQWLDFVRDQPPGPERERRWPRVSGARGRLELRESEGGQVQLTLAPTSRAYVATRGQLITYPARQRRAQVDWLRLPVAGVSFEDAQAYAAWLDRTGRLPGARLCREREWERAARGADDRLYPSGDVLLPDDANFDETYGRQPLAFGPDEVGAHPRSDSPFGVADLAGNLWEWTQPEPSRARDATVFYRGGSWYHDRLSSQSTNRSAGEVSQRTLYLGLRVCASPKGLIP